MSLPNISSKNISININGAKDKSDIQTGQVEVQSQMTSILSELGKLIKKHGFNKSLIQLKALNKGNIAGSEIELFEFIINQTCSEFKTPIEDLYNRKKSATHARMTVFVLLSRYMNYSHKHIGSLFEKERVTITTNIISFSSMERARKKAAFQDYFIIYDLIDEKVKQKISNFK